MEEHSKDRPWLLFLGVVLLLVGVYGTLRTVVNMVAFNKYPIGGVLTFGMRQAPVDQYQRESDCSNTYYYTAPLYYDKDNVVTRKPTLEEVQSAEQQKQQVQTQLENCLMSVSEARDASKVADLSQSLLLLLLGAVVMIGRKIFSNKSLKVSL